METLLNYCSVCLRYTNHKELFRKGTHSQAYEDFLWNEDFLIVECMGCNNVSFRKEYIDMDSPRDPETNEMETDVLIYPLVLKHRNLLPDIYLLPFNVRITYKESIDALKSNCKLLTAAGFRAVIEAVCNDKGIKENSILEKIDCLHSKGFLSKTEADRLHAVRFLGNDSIHEMKVPTEKNILSALIIIEHLLSNLYLIDEIISDTIDTMIVKYSDFEELLDKKIKYLKKDDKVHLRTIFGKSSRRIKTENLKIFETELIENITRGMYVKLSIDDITKENIAGKNIDVQNYIVLVDNPIRRRRPLKRH